MKKLILIATLTCALFGTDFSNKQGGFVANNISKISVAKASKSPDDTKVILQGKITKELKHEKYEFSDETGSIPVEIDDKVWQGLTVTPNDLIEIEGYIDDDAFEPKEVEVKKVRKL